VTGKAGIMSGEESQWRPPGPPAWIMIRPDPLRDEWRQTLCGPESGFLCGCLELPASASIDQAKHRAAANLADFGRTYYRLSFTVDWRPSDDSEWTCGDIRSTPSQ
jgi:hypothetical protein